MLSTGIRITSSNRCDVSTGQNQLLHGFNYVHLQQSILLPTFGTTVPTSNAVTTSDAITRLDRPMQGIFSTQGINYMSVHLQQANRFCRLRKELPTRQVAIIPRSDAGQSTQPMAITQVNN
ncbi:unnamed protein product [Caenorhabditis angaria]|uniref:Uncharacterized protein n=1 Tax=Caenorhabditis angaria TaxID=860376 RepID=A0A9P1MTR3_9PELO|nr:unnamed protein product [Caenorhabditis angaria]